jgi:hypothetical protein
MMKFKSIFSLTVLVLLFIYNAMLYGNDFYLDLAYRWAPIHYQDVDRAGTNSLRGESDYITRIDFDGDWNMANNADNAARCHLPAACYYSVVMTKTHYFIIYSFFHALDWKLKGGHENDLEGFLAIVEKGGLYYGTLMAIVTVSHLDFYSYIVSWTNHKTFERGYFDVDGDIILKDFNGEQHPTTMQEARGHGLKAWDGKNFKGGDGIVYYPSKNTSQDPSGPNDRHVLYKLIDIFEPGGLWYRIHNKETFEQWNKFRGGGANPPWGWDDWNDGDDLPGGEMALDPAKLTWIYFSIPSDFSFDYGHNQYVGITYSPYKAKQWRSEEASKPLNPEEKKIYDSITKIVRKRYNKAKNNAKRIEHINE